MSNFKVKMHQILSFIVIRRH